MTSTSKNYPDPTVGKILPEQNFTVTDESLDDYFEGLKLDRSAFDKGDTPLPSMTANAADNYFELSRFDQDKGHLWMRQEWQFNAPLQRETSYVTRATIKDIYERRDRTVVNTAVSVLDQQGEVVITSNHHQSFLLPPPVNQVKFRDPTKKEGVRKFVVPTGDRIEPFERKISLEMCGKFFHGNTSYHTDLNASQELGFQDVVVGGRMTMSYMGHLLDSYFGPSWWTSGYMDVKFTNPTWPEDHITVNGIATGPLEDDPSREGVFGWIEKSDGTIVLITNASIAR